jgi:hypothetical protein
VVSSFCSLESFIVTVPVPNHYFNGVGKPRFVHGSNLDGSIWDKGFASGHESILPRSGFFVYVG